MRTAATQSALLRGHPRAEIRTPYGPCQNKKNYLTSEDKGSLVFVGAEESGLGVGIPGEHPLHQDILGVLHTANHKTVYIWYNQSENTPLHQDILGVLHTANHKTASILHTTNQRTFAPSGYPWGATHSQSSHSLYWVKPIRERPLHQDVFGVLHTCSTQPIIRQLRFGTTNQRSVLLDFGPTTVMEL